MTDSFPEYLSDLPQTSFACAPFVLHLHKKFEVNQTKIKGDCQSYTKAADRESWSDLTLATFVVDHLIQYMSTVGQTCLFLRVHSSGGNWI